MMKLSMLSTCAAILIGVSPALAQENVAGVKADSRIGGDVVSIGGTFDDYVLQTSVEYDLGHGTSIALAHEFSRDQNVDSRQIGFRFSQVFD